MSTLPHHLAAVWFADIVGYTRLSEEDEAGAWRLVQIFQTAVHETVARHGGRLVKFLGDGALAEFPSTERAIRSAHDLKSAFPSAARAAAMGDRSLRIGVHVGDVGATPDGDLFGDGVNVASRIQAAAEPGEVWVSEDVRRQVRQRKELRFESRGERELKGLRHSLAVHAVNVVEEESGVPSRATAPVRGRRIPIARGRGLAFLAIGILIALAAGITTWVARDRDGRPPLPTMADLPAPPTSASSVAVLPFVNLSGEAGQEYFSDGLTEEILNELAKVPGLKVPARTSSFAFKDRNVPIEEIASTLGVAHVLEGSVRRAGSKVRITAQLSDARTGFHLWSETYDRELADVFAVQTDVARAVAQALQLEIRQHGEGESGTTNTDAHILYLRGKYILENRFSQPELRRAQELFRQAIAADPDYPAPRVGLAGSWVFLADDWLPPHEAYPRAKEEIGRALEAAPDYGPALSSLAIVQIFYDWDFHAAAREVSEAMGRNPNFPDLHASLGLLLALQGDTDRALSEFARTTELDPLSPSQNIFTARVLLGMRRYVEAESAALRALEIAPNYPHALRWRGEVMLVTGRPAEALETFRSGLMTNPGIAGLQNGEARALTMLGRRDEARGIVERMQADAKKRYVRAEEIAGIWAALGEADLAFRWLDQAVEERSAGIPFLTLYPMYDPLRTDSRFDRLVRDIGLSDPNR